MNTRHIRTTSKQPSIGRSSWLCAVGTMAYQGFLTHPSARIAAFRPVAGLEDWMHPGGGGA